LSEFALIDHIRSLASAARSDVALGIGDDCALLSLAAGEQLAVSTDTLNQGVHFLPGCDARALGHKALAVSLSDLAAMGARPMWALLNLSLPAADPAWADAFMQGLLALAAEHEVALVGGDTCSGPLSITVTAMGSVAVGAALTRAGARPGHEIWVSGTLGDAAHALRLLQAGEQPPPGLAARLHQPTPRVALGMALRGMASACIDISDGLLADLGHICAASACAAELQLASLPGSSWLHELPADERWPLQLGGGDDYELCFCVPPGHADRLQALAAQLSVPLAQIGRVQAGQGLVCLAPDGSPLALPQAGYEHFAS
jgi:thiamine-monophosphate kinase